MTDKTGGPAFPVEVLDKQRNGMTLRDYFAAQALTGSQIWDAVLNDKNAVLAQEGGAERLAQVAYAVADAMLKARTK